MCIYVWHVYHTHVYLTCTSHVYICLASASYSQFSSERISANSSAFEQTRAQFCKFKRILANSSAFLRIRAHFSKFERTFANLSALLWIQAHSCKFERTFANFHLPQFQRGSAPDTMTKSELPWLYVVNMMRRRADFYTHFMLQT